MSDNEQDQNIDKEIEEPAEEDKNEEQVNDENNADENENVDLVPDSNQKTEEVIVEDTITDSTKVINYIIDKISENLPHYNEKLWKYEYEDVITSTFIDDTDNTAKLFFYIEDNMGLLLQQECPQIENTFIYFIKDSDIKILT